MDAERDKTITVIKEFMPDVILVDSYYVTYNYLDRLKKFVKLVYIDDINSFSYLADALINYNSSAMELDYCGLYKGSRVKLPQMLLGENFIPLRQEFQHLRQVPVKKVQQIYFFQREELIRKKSHEGFYRKCFARKICGACRVII